MPQSRDQRWDLNSGWPNSKSYSRPWVTQAHPMRPPYQKMVVIRLLLGWGLCSIWRRQIITMITHQHATSSSRVGLPLSEWMEVWDPSCQGTVGSPAAWTSTVLCFLTKLLPSSLTLMFGMPFWRPHWLIKLPLWGLVLALWFISPGQPDLGLKPGSAPGWPWANCLASLSPSLLLCKEQIMYQLYGFFWE